MNTKKRVIDWEAVELQYRAGIRSLKDIGSEFGVSDAGIIKRAKRDGWERDLSAKIQAKAEAKVSASLVSAEVSAQTKIAERQIIEVNAQAVAGIRLSHRADFQRTRRIANSMLSELEQQTDPETLAMLRDLGTMMRQDDDRGQDRRNDLYNKVIDLTERSKTLKTLTESLQKVVDMERQAFGMDKDSKNEADSLGKLLNRIAQGNSNGFSPVENDPERHSKSLPLSKDDPDDE